MFSLVELKKYTVEDDSCTKNLMLNTQMNNLWKQLIYNWNQTLVNERGWPLLVTQHRRQETPPWGLQSSMVGSQNAWETRANALNHNSKPVKWECVLAVSLTMLEQALANVIYLGLNCRQQIGPVCLPSNNATFIPLSAFHTWIFPSSEPGRWRHVWSSLENHLKP